MAGETRGRGARAKKKKQQQEYITTFLFTSLFVCGGQFPLTEEETNIYLPMGLGCLNDCKDPDFMYGEEGGKPSISSSGLALPFLTLKLQCTARYHPTPPYMYIYVNIMLVV